MIVKKITYFDEPGKQNTPDCIEAVKERLKEGDINHVIVASGSGTTALKLADIEQKTICVTYHAGSKHTEQLNKNRQLLVEQGIEIVTGTHTLSAGERSIAAKWNGVYPLLLMAETYRTISEGLKVCVEVSLIAADAGKVPKNEKILVIGGTSKGCDTAVVLKTACSCSVLQDLAINEIICMPITEGNKHDAR